MHKCLKRLTTLIPPLSVCLSHTHPLLRNVIFTCDFRETSRRRERSGRSAGVGVSGSNNPSGNSIHNNSDDEEDVQVAGSDGQAMDEDQDTEGIDDSHVHSRTTSNSNALSRNNAVAISQASSLSTMFAQPTHLMVSYSFVASHSSLYPPLLSVLFPSTRREDSWAPKILRRMQEGGCWSIYRAMMTLRVMP